MRMPLLVMSIGALAIGVILRLAQLGRKVFAEGVETTLTINNV